MRNSISGRKAVLMPPEKVTALHRYPNHNKGVSQRKAGPKFSISLRYVNYVLQRKTGVLEKCRFRPALVTCSIRNHYQEYVIEKQKNLKIPFISTTDNPPAVPSCTQSKVCGVFSRKRYMMEDGRPRKKLS